MPTTSLFVAAACVALNLTLAKVAAMLALPVYLDSIGTFIGVALLPLPMALLVAILTSATGGFVVNPFFHFYVGTQIAIALTVWSCMRLGLMKTWYGSLLSGVFVALVAVICSAPVTTILFGGVTYGTTTALNALFIASGQNVLNSVLSGSAIVESIDKPIAALLAWTALSRLPSHVRNSQGARR